MQPPRSLWWDTLEGSVNPRETLQGHHDVDVAIVGGGFTGLWSARELLRRDPSLRICVVEKSVCGFGASGRNGGWASALYPLGDDALIKGYGVDAYRLLRRQLETSVITLGDSIRADNIDAHYVRGGSLSFARSEIQAARLKKSVNDAHDRGDSTEDLRWLSVSEARERGSLSNSFGATYTPHCARIHPARLVRGLADVVERLGGRVYENSAVMRIIPARTNKPAQVVSASATVHARYVIRATEGFTPTLPGLRRRVVPIYSLMIATDVLSEDFWLEHGFAQYETFADDRHLIIYGQRTNDNRIAFGGRGAPYHFASSVEERYDQNPKIFRAIERTLRSLFPRLESQITHRWGGPLAMPRDLSPYAVVDHESGMASAGGYTGDGVVLSYVAANALADLICSPGVETPFSTLPFVQHQNKNWEVEPLRWLGVNFGLSLAAWADHVEERRHKESRASGLLDRLFDQFPP